MNNSHYIDNGVAAIAGLVLYTAKDIQEIFKCGRKKAYEIMHIPGFPSFKIDTLLFVEKGELEKWVARSKNKRITT